MHCCVYSFREKAWWLPQCWWGTFYCGRVSNSAMRCNCIPFLFTSLAPIYFYIIHVSFGQVFGHYQVKVSKWSVLGHLQLDMHVEYLSDFVMRSNSSFKVGTVLTGNMLHFLNFINSRIVASRILVGKTSKVQCHLMSWVPSSHLMDIILVLGLCRPSTNSMILGICDKNTKTHKFCPINTKHIGGASQVIAETMPPACPIQV